MREIGSRVEMFVDHWLIERMAGTALRLHPPVKREVVFTADQPWENHWTGYYSVVQDGDMIRLYYRGASEADGNGWEPTCCAESGDGITFTRPKLGLVDFNGSTANNIIWRGVISHNFAAFRDANPAADPAARYKALGGLGFEHAGLYALGSADGLHWSLLQEAPVMTEGAFDSQNIAFWDARIGAYRCYSRYIVPTEETPWFRAIQSCTSADFLHWTPPVPNAYTVPPEEFYTNATVPCPGAEHIYLSFPKRFLPGRHKVLAHDSPGVSDAVFMTSRDGVHWDRTFREAWVRPGRDERNWTQRSNMTAWGIAETAPDEFSLYISEHYSWPDNRLRRMTVRRHGFAAVHGGVPGGEMVTRAFTFTGARLHLNYATSAAGSLRCELQQADGTPIRGFTLADFPALYGDEIDAVAAWAGGDDLSALAGTPVRLRVALEDADLFAIQLR
ncbi:MAG TPA: hypothetical protein PK794_11930 [Armatimonadota bacterium]|nr:hypothetical protein [Armatimonadota bacterium]